LRFAMNLRPNFLCPPFTLECQILDTENHAISAGCLPLILELLWC
jgi:hypothetical protein